MKIDNKHFENCFEYNFTLNICEQIIKMVVNILNGDLMNGSMRDEE